MSTVTTRLRENEIRPDHLRAGQAEALRRDVKRLQATRDAFVACSCPACEQDRPRPRFHKHGFDWTECGSCGTCYMNPRPTETILADYYAGSELYAYWAEHVFPASDAARREKIHAPRLDRIVAECDRLGIARGTLLEVGAGYGTFCSLAAQRGAFSRIIAIEPTVDHDGCRCGPRVQWIARRIEEVSDDELPPVDVACSFETIEHLLNPRAFVEDCGRRLRGGGLLVLTCPNVRGFEVEVLGAAAPAVQPEHINLFHPDSLRGLVERCGLDVIEVTTPGRLDAELVRKAVLAGDFDLSGQCFLRRVLRDEWERLGGPFQEFLAQNGLSSHMWLMARKP
ncbi:MAG: class I SAM-dependent methyltransferase [Planctomycetes bacterium]|nr:class I SAM-dependent methyltransferase [Planctomycetota bacterium]